MIIDNDDCCYCCSNAVASIGYRVTNAHHSCSTHHQHHHHQQSNAITDKNVGNNNLTLVRARAFSLLSILHWIGFPRNGHGQSNCTRQQSRETYYDDVRVSMVSVFFLFSSCHSCLVQEYGIMCSVGCSQESQWRSKQRKKNHCRQINQHSPLPLFCWFQFHFKLNIPNVSSAATAVNNFQRNFFLHSKFFKFIPFLAAPSHVRARSTCTAYQLTYMLKIPLHVNRNWWLETSS